MRGAIIIEGHVQGLANTRALGRKGIPVIVINADKLCIARYSKYCKKFFICPPYHADSLADFMIDLAQQEHLDGWVVFPSNDHAVITLSKHQKVLSAYYQILTPDKEVIENIYDKLTLARIATGAGVSVPATWGISDLDPGRIIYPCIVKGRHGLDFYKEMGRKAIVCHNPHELKVVLDQPMLKRSPELVLVQEVIPFEGSNHTISVATFSVNGEVQTYWMGEKLRQHPEKFGTATLTRSIDTKAPLESTKRIMKALNYQGISETEFILDPRTGMHQLIEINARTWLWTGHAAACGVDFAWLAWQHATGAQVDYPTGYTTGLKWRNFYTDSYFSIKAMLQGKLSFRGWIRGSKGGKVPAVWASDDPLPFVMLTLFLPSLAINR
jgi:D-aspartate ligase